MNDEAHVLLVNAHTKGNRCDDDLDLVLHPVFLDHLPLMCIHLSVVDITGNAVISFQFLTELLAVLYGEAVNDATFAFQSTC